jgi:hypothetical protein
MPQRATSAASLAPPPVAPKGEPLRIVVRHRASRTRTRTRTRTRRISES